MLKLDGLSMNVENKEREKLKSVFPQCFSEGKLDINKLLKLCGEYISNDFEKYKFEWKGKDESLKLSQQRSNGTLRPCKEESVNFDDTSNLYIEGDNLEVLKLLQTAYYNKIKMIYIDPPYNTGNNFIYKDDFKNPIKHYKEVTSQATKSNSESMGRFHTAWLNMMYPRLRLARNLLCNNGVIFISIDYHESHNLRKLCDEVFGEENFVGEIIRKTKSMTGDDSNGFNLQHDLLIIYAKSKQNLKFIGKEKDFKGYSNPDKDPLGEWCSGDPTAKSGGNSTYFPIENPYTHKKDYPPKGRFWAFSKNTLEEYIKKGKVKFKVSYKDGERGFIFKRYKCDTENLNKPLNSLMGIENNFMNQNATSELKSLFNADYFDYPKPVQFLYELIKSCTIANNNDIILDFFSGSSTTAHACMKLNKEDGGNRKFIMVQLPELCTEKSEAFKAGYKNICEIGKERIRIVGQKLLEESNKKINSDESKNSLDVGFKVFKLDTSNLKIWDETSIDKNTQLLLERFNNMVINVKDDRTNLDMVYEIMLKIGVPLDCTIIPIKVNDKEVYSIGEDIIRLICLQDRITVEDIEKMAKYSPEKIILTENSIASDSAMSSIYYILESLNIELEII